MIIRRNEIHKLDLADKIVGVTSGCFDLLHFYHLRYLERCKALCDFLIVGVDSDTLVQQNKNKVPMIPEHHRVAMVDALKCVDATFQMDAIQDIVNFYPICNKVFKNGNVIYGQKVEVEGDAELVIIPDIEEVCSTTTIIEKIRMAQKFDSPICGCDGVELGSGDATVPISHPSLNKKIWVDKCIAGEVLDLLDKGIKTVGSCCGHNKTIPSIMVDIESVSAMESLGYVHCFNRCIPEGELSKCNFFPKSIDCSKWESWLGWTAEKSSSHE